MAMLRPLKSILRQNKKKKPNAFSFSPKISGLGSQAPSYGGYSKQSSYNHDFYNNVTPKTYDLPLDTPAVRQTQYDQYDSQIAHHFIEMQETAEPVHEIQRNIKKDILASHKDHIAFINDLKNENIEVSERLLDVSDIWKEHTSDHSTTLDSPAVTDRVINLDTLLNESESLPDPADVLDSFAQLKKALPDDHPDVVNLRSQVNFIMDNLELFPQPEDFGIVRDFELDMTNPYLDDDLDENSDPFHEQNLMNTQQLEVNEEILEHNLMSNESLFESEDTQYTLNDMLSCETESFDGIEQVVQQDNSMMSSPEHSFQEPAMEGEAMVPFDNMEYGPDQNNVQAMNEIDQAIDSIGNQPQESNTDPVPQQIQPDPLIQQQMYEEDLLNQHLNNPYQMPGMSNPFGPAPGL